MIIIANGVAGVVNMLGTIPVFFYVSYNFFFGGWGWGFQGVETTINGFVYQEY